MTSVEFFTGVRDNAFYVGFMVTLGAVMMNTISGLLNGVISIYVARRQQQVLSKILEQRAKQGSDSSGNQ